ncbi:hypothetical protein ILUMI_27504 [Ignelater luminosus]|uniref:Uncharacterized protein n=1 Tax=Ignelater luminosus TaxID=2038154 RepID=A0A8K0FWW1_IGNLU|nr:hypothetical protein ILUMI_27504 [Ignelater luminosus]
MNNTHEKDKIMQSKSMLKNIQGATIYINDDVARREREKQKVLANLHTRKEVEQGRGKISRSYDRKVTGKSGDGNTMTEMAKKMEWKQKRAVNKYDVKAENLT